MKTTKAVAVCIFSFAFFILFTGCDKPKPKFVPESAHAPAPRAWTEAQVDALVSMEQVSIYSPAPCDNGTPPAECDYIRFLRFKLKSAPEDASLADAACIMIPGVVEGANGFEHIARQMVYIAKTQYGKTLEVWAFDRRNNCIEDATGIDEAEKAPTISEAETIFIDYYYNGVPINGKTFGGFLTSKDVPYLSEFGLRMDTEDIYKIITTMIPDPEVRKSKMFVGGHSLGGLHTSMFAGWDFDGDPATTDDAGYNNCAGMFALDSILEPTSSMIEPVIEMLPESVRPMAYDMTRYVYDSIVAMLRNNTLIRTVPFLDGEVGALMESLGYLAYKAPDAEHTAIKNVPYSDNVILLNRFMHSRTLERFLTGADDIKKYRFTNEAMLGVLFDDDFAPMGMIQASLGFLRGGQVVEKDFPMSEDIEAIPGLAELIGGFTGTEQLYIASQFGSKAPLYTWANFDEIGTEADPYFTSTDGSLAYTSIYDEVSDIHDFARAQFIGPSNLIEWYFSIRRLVDIIAATAPFGPDYGLNFMYPEEVKAMPQIEFPAGNSFSESLASGKYPLMEGYNHMDPMFAAVDRTGIRQSEVIVPLIEFILANAGD